MNARIKQIVHEISKASDEERISFPDVVKTLMEVGVERYLTDLVAASRTFYMPKGEIEVVRCHETSAPAQEFSAEGVEKALRAIQHGEIGYREFCERIAAAGCAGYIVSLSGRRALYYGRSNDFYVEWFPGAKP
jgi:uncharacterized protein YbcV (DUF1398 family)